MGSCTKLALAAAFFATGTSTCPAQELKPGASVEYKQLAFFPQRWEAAKISTQLYPWAGENVVLLTTSPDFDHQVMARFVGRLDAGWKLYADLTGRFPAPLRQLDDKATIAAVPRASLTCGYGCGYVGATGIEVAGFYSKDYPLAVRDQEAFAHYLFYEMGRNYYTFGDRHSLFVTGYAVFMRYVCMDTLKCRDPDTQTRRTIEKCEVIYAASDVPFLTAFTNLSEGEKGHRLTDADGRVISPSDQPVMYATAMWKLYRENGENAWLKRFFRHLRQCPPVKVRTTEEALDQSLNWLVSASAAAGKDLTPVFVDRWRMPMSDALRQALSNVDWSDRGLNAGRVLTRVKAQAAEAP